ncbi:hypothetical protein [Tolypothrix sp. NIES-4075]|nr:hypothetical protein [Tolypothrix sp. NIES-4075]
MSAQLYDLSLFEDATWRRIEIRFTRLGEVTQVKYKGCSTCL